MSNQRLVLIETGYGEGVLFDQKDTVQAFQLLSRAIMVRTGSTVTPKDGADVEIKLIAPSKFQEAPPEPLIPPMHPADPIAIAGPTDF